MPQLYAQMASRPGPWLLGRTSAGLCTLQTACPLTVTYSGGTPAADTIAAGSAATVYGGSAAAFDAAADVWVVLTVPGSGALGVAKEADLGAVTGDWAGLARVVQHSTEPYQPQAYLGAGGVGTVPTTTGTQGSLAAEGKVYPLGSEPGGWHTLAFDDSAWAAPVLQTLPTAGFSPALAGTDWITAVAVGEALGYTWLYRRVFVPPAGTITSAALQIHVDDYTTGIWLNTTLVGTIPSGSPTFDPVTFALPAGLLVPGAPNVLAIGVVNLSAGSATSLNYLLSWSSVPSGGVPDPGGHEGDLLYYHDGAWVSLPAGTNGYELTLVSGDPAWTAQPASGGTVTSVALAGPTGTTVSGSPVTSSGTLTLSWASQTANTVLAAPNGSSGAPTFRVLAAADIPSLPASQIGSGQLATARGGTGLDGSAAANGALLIGNGSGYTLATLTAGSGITITNASGTVTIALSGGGSGTVTSVALTVPGFLSVSGSPITTSGTLAVTLATQSAGTVFAGPASGSAAAPTFRALAGSDLPAAAAAGGHIHAHGHFL